VGQGPREINWKPVVAARSSDVVIVSDEAGGQNNRWRSQGPLGRCGVSDLVSAAGRKSDYGTNAHERDRPCGGVKVALRRRRASLTACLKPYWGKPAVRNFRGGGGTEVDGLMTFCHDA